MFVISGVYCIDIKWIRVVRTCKQNWTWDLTAQQPNQGIWISGQWFYHQCFCYDYLPVSSEISSLHKEVEVEVLIRIKKRKISHCLLEQDDEEGKKSPDKKEKKAKTKSIDLPIVSQVSEFSRDVINLLQEKEVSLCRSTVDHLDCKTCVILNVFVMFSRPCSLIIPDLLHVGSSILVILHTLVNIATGYLVFRSCSWAISWDFSLEIISLRRKFVTNCILQSSLKNEEVFILKHSGK